MFFRPLIYCVGDSHSTFFSGHNRICTDNGWRRRIPCFYVHHLGPVLAYSLPQTGTTTGGREKFLGLLGKKIPAGAWVMTVFGEIDGRAHLLRQACKQGRPVEAVVEDCAERYFSFVLELRERGFRPIVYNVVASLMDQQSDPAAAPTEFPFVGSQEERNTVMRLLNDALKRHCVRHSVPFLETFDLLLDERGRTRPECYMDEVHLSQYSMPATMRRLQALLPELPLRLPPRYWRALKREGFHPGED